MVKLCWEKSGEENLWEYYYDFQESKVYKICLANFCEQSKFKLTPAVVCMIGPCVTLTGILFDDAIAIMNFWNTILSTVFTVVGIILINRSYDLSERHKEKYIKENGKGERMSNKQIQILFRKGRREMLGWCGVLCIFLFLLWFAVFMYENEKNITSVLMFYGCIIFSFLTIKMMCPLKRYKMLCILKNDKYKL